jgi:hypothetical protein
LLLRRRTIGVAAGLGAIVATAALAAVGTGSRRLASPLGPEGVPIPVGAPLAPPRLLHDGDRIDGIDCQRGERLAYHIHVHLQLVVRGSARQVPGGIGIGTPYDVLRTSAGAFFGGACFMWLHTHAADGIVHVESPVERTYTLGEFFDIWGQRLDRHRVGPARGRVTALFDGRLFKGNPRLIPLLPHSQIELEVGRPLVAPEHVTFPTGL